MGGKCCSWLATASTILGIYFGVTIFFVFTFYYHNNHAGTWGLFSGECQTQIGYSLDLVESR